MAPSLVPKRSGDRIKTDRCDAINLVRLFRAGELTSIYVPTAEDEAIRDLLRCRVDIRRIERKNRQQLLAFLGTWILILYNVNLDNKRSG